MRWADERYVRVYTRDTGEWLALGWEAQSLFLLALRKADRAGIVHAGKAGPRGLAGMTGVPVDVVLRALPLLLEDGCLRETPGGYIIPNYIAAQETSTTDAQRKRDQRERDRARVMAEGGPVSKMAGDTIAHMERSRSVTESHAMASRVESQAVTGGHDVSQEVTPNRAVPSRAEPFSASQEPEPVPEPFALELQKPGKRPRKQSAAEVVFEKMEARRKERCEELGEPFVREHWDGARINAALGKVAKDTESAQALFTSAWGLYLADDGNRVRKPAWSLAFFMTAGVRARYETDAARLEGAQ